MNKSSKHRGFTLAEVLITLAVIGVVASIAIPSMVNSYQEQGALLNIYLNNSLILTIVYFSEIRFLLKHMLHC